MFYRPLERDKVSFTNVENGMIDIGNTTNGNNITQEVEVYAVSTKLHVENPYVPDVPETEEGDYGEAPAIPLKHFGEDTYATADQHSKQGDNTKLNNSQEHSLAEILQESVSEDGDDESVACDAQHEPVYEEAGSVQDIQSSSTSPSNDTLKPQAPEESPYADVDDGLILQDNDTYAGMNEEVETTHSNDTAKSTVEVSPYGHIDEETVMQDNNTYGSIDEEDTTKLEDQGVVTSDPQSDSNNTGPDSNASMDPDYYNVTTIKGQHPGYYNINDGDTHYYNTAVSENIPELQDGIIYSSVSSRQ